MYYHRNRLGQFASKGGGGGSSKKSATKSNAKPGSKPKAKGKSKSRKKVTISQASSAMAKKGYKLGAAKYDPKTKMTSYKVTKGGKTSTMTSKAIIDKFSP